MQQKCIRCGIEKKITEFALDNRRKSGYASHCKECGNVTQRKKRTGTRICKDCKQLKSVADFATTRICKACKTTKVCKLCAQRLPLTKFDGYHGLVCVDCRREKDAKRYLAQKEDVLWRNKKWREKNAGKDSDYRKRQLRLAKERMEFRRAAIFSAYGGAVCSCCGETEPLFLTIDHINGNGNQHRAEIRKNIIDWLYLNNFPPGFQILCYNCNLGKQRNGGICCPHKEKTHCG